MCKGNCSRLQCREDRLWKNINDIVRVLNIVTDNRNVNHTLLPIGGGLDLAEAKSSCEEGNIELRNGSPGRMDQ